MLLLQGGDPSSSSATTADMLVRPSEDSTQQSGKVMTLTVRENEKIPLSIEQIKHMPWKDFVKLWKDYVNRLAVCLVESSGDADSPASRRLEALIEEISLFTSCLATSNPRSHAISRYASWCDSPGIAPQGVYPPLEIRKAPPGPPRHFQKCSSTLYNFTLISWGATRYTLALNLEEPAIF